MTTEHKKSHIKITLTANLLLQCTQTRRETKSCPVFFCPAVVSSALYTFYLSEPDCLNFMPFSGLLGFMGLHHHFSIQSK